MKLNNFRWFCGLNMVGVRRKSHLYFFTRLEGAQASGPFAGANPSLPEGIYSRE